MITRIEINNYLLSLIKNSPYSIRSLSSGTISHDEIVLIIIFVLLYTYANKLRNTQDGRPKKQPKVDAPCFVRDINEPLNTGSCIVIRGKIQPECTRFCVNLLSCRAPNKSDIAFHFNPRLACRYIVRNSRINNSWGEEETTSIEKFKLDRNKIFEIQIVAAEREFYVALDGRHVCAYIYRVALEKVNKVQVDGIDVKVVEIVRKIKTYPSVEGLLDIKDVNFKQVEAYPATSLESIAFSVPMGDGYGADKISDQQLVVPVTATLPDGFKQGWQLQISGRVKILPSSFYINLQQGTSLWPHPIIPLHLNPRFYTSYGKHLFVRNSWMNGQWGAEERTQGFQFTPGQNFNLAIRKNVDHFSVWVDGILAGEFLFRTPVDDIDTVYIHGDVQIHSVLMKDHIDDKYFSKSREKINTSL